MTKQSLLAAAQEEHRAIAARVCAVLLTASALHAEPRRWLADQLAQELGTAPLEIDDDGHVWIFDRTTWTSVYVRPHRVAAALDALGPIQLAR